MQSCLAVQSDWSSAGNHLNLAALLRLRDSRGESHWLSVQHNAVYQVFYEAEQ